MRKILLFFIISILMCSLPVFGQNLQVNLPTNTGVFTSYPVTGGFYSWETVPYESYKEVISDTHFRIKFPPGYVKGGGTKYPIVVFFHGAGEFGTDNRKQLIHGGQRHHDAIESGEFPGIAVYPQKAVNDLWNGVFPVLQILNAVISNADVDVDRIYIHGLSAGGKGTWLFLHNYYRCVAAAAPMSSSLLFLVSNTDDPTFLSRKECTPIWLSQGGNDKVAGASPADANEIVRTLRNNGSYIRYSYYPTGGHGIWNDTYNSVDPETNTRDFFKWFLARKLNDIHVFYEENQQCADEPLNLVLGAKPGHSGYQWRKDGNLITTATTNKLTVTEPGTYEVRFTRGSPSGGINWPGIGEQTPWSDPVSITLGRDKTPVVTISNKKRSVNLPALDGSTSVDIVASPDQAEYQWYRGLNLVQTSPDSIYSANTSGDYGVKVTEAEADDFFIDNLSDYNGDGIPEPKEVPLQFRPDAPRCYSDLSNLITVTTENQPGVPNKPKNVFLTLNASSNILINWDDNSTNESGYEIYRAVNPGGPYTLIEITSPKTTPNPQFFIDTEIDQNTTYYYVLRAVNDKGGSEYTAEKSISTSSDLEPPSTSLLSVLRPNTNYVDLAWTRATDNFSVLLYNVYLDGNLYTSISDTTVRISGLLPETVYQFYIEAVDDAGNVSNPSNLVTQATVVNGVFYSYYEGVWDWLPDFNQLTPVTTGIIPNVSLSPRLQNDYFGFKYEAVINIPTTGTYTFYTASDDGSKLYVDGTQVVNNDGLHGVIESSGQITLTEGSHDFEVVFFEKGGGEALTVRWQGPGISKQIIPNSAFINSYEYPPGPDAPSGFVAIPSAYNQVDLSWTDDVSNETNFEIYRSESLSGPFQIINTLPAGASSFSDNSVSASTSYFYQIASINGQGSSIKPNQDYRVFMPLNGNIDDISPSPVTNTVTGTAVFSTLDFVEGDNSLDLRAPSTTYLNIDNAGEFINTAFSERTISLWFKTYDVTPNQTLFEEGGSTDGIALRVTGGNLEFGVTNSGSQVSISTPVAENTWNHIVGVFNYGKLSLYLNGILANSDADVGYSTIGDHSNAAGLGATSGSDAFGRSTTGAYFNGFIDAFMMYTKALNINEVIQLYNFPGSLASVATPTLPPSPEAPTGLIASEVSSTQIDLTWNDNSDNETGFEIYRTTSPVDIGWILIHTTTAGVTNYSDTGLDGNSTYSYKVRAVSNELASDYSNIANATTTNNAPVFLNVIDRSIKLNSTLNILVQTDDPDGDALTITATDLPGFGSFTDNLDGTATLSFTTGSSCPGGLCDYVISLFVSDGVIVTQDDFNLSVGENNPPVLSDISDQTVVEGRVLDVDITIKDADNDVKVVVLGSSTAAGVGAAPTDSAWVNRLAFYLQNISNSAEVVNLAQSGFTTEDIRPTGSTPAPDVTRNINAAVNQSPDIIIINLPSNNVAQDIPVATTITHYNEIKSVADANNIPIFFTTTQPRDFDGESLSAAYTPAQRRQLLADEAQAIRDNFGNLVIDIYDELTDFSNDKRIRADYNAGDNIHVNNQGHRYIFNTVKSTLINYAGINDLDIQVNNLPSFASIIKDIYGRNYLRFQPGYYDAGTFAEIEVFALDGNGGSSSDKFNLNVVNTTSSSTAFINFSGETAPPTSPWMNTGAHTNGTLANIIDDEGFNTGWTLDFATGSGFNWMETQIGNSVLGIYPPEVMSTRFRFTSENITDFVELELAGLSTELSYDLILFGSRDEDPGQDINTSYTIGGIAKTLNIADNSVNTVVFQDVAADVDGKIKIRVSQGSTTSTTNAYLNSMIVYSFFDSGLPPATPGNLVLTQNQSNTVSLTWDDNSDNERRFTIYRSLSINGTYDSIASVSPNVTSYSDTTDVTGHTTYYYKIGAGNNNGITYSSVKSIFTLNNNPTLLTNLMYTVPSGQLTDILINGSDPDSDLLTYSGENLPSFVSIISNGDGTGTLKFDPETYDVGNFTGSKIYVQEAYQGLDMKEFYVNVLSGEFDEQVYVNFSPVSTFDETPFNTIAVSPVEGNSFPMLKSILNETTQINMVVGSGWSGASASGATTLTNTGIIIDTVLLTNWFTGNSANLTFNGLDNDKLYNITFFGSDTTASSATRYTVEGNPVDLITGTNTTSTAQLNGISPGNNKIDINIAKINSSINGHINAILIQSYHPSIIPAPTNLTVVGGKNDELELRWNDNSGNETGFEIYRKELPDGSSSLIATTSSNQTSYVNTGLIANKTYEYRIRAISIAGYSDYSNTASGSTFEFQVKINVSGPPDAQPTASPPSPDATNNDPTWYNLYTSAENGTSYFNLTNDQEIPTSIDLTMDEIGVGFDRNFGHSTGDNSGIYPDAVLKSFYFYEPNDDLGQWTISDLDPSYAYNITFTGSCEGWLLDAFDAKGITEYIINDQSLFLDTRDNTSGSVTFYNISPNGNNEIVVNVRAAKISGVNYGLLNAIVIQGYSKINRSEDENFYTYYARNNTDISQSSSWNTRIDGTGAVLPSFDDPGIEYIIDGNSSITAANNLIIGGNGSILKVKDNATISLDPGVTNLEIPGLAVYDGKNLNLNTSATTSPSLIVSEGGVAIRNGAVLDFDSLNMNVTGTGGINTNGENGLLAVRNGSLSLMGTSDLDQQLFFLPGRDTLKSFTVNNTGTGSVIIGNTMHIRNSVKLEDGILDANGNLVLVSDEKATANLLKIETGALVVGDVEFQRYWKRPVGTAGFFYIGHPIQNQTIGDWVGEFQINGLANNAWKNLNVWDEPQNKWMPVASATTPLLPGHGVNAFMFSQNFVDQFIRYNNVGPVNQGDFTFDLSYTPGTNPGWNLVANPYPCAIDWSLIQWDDPGFANRVDAAFYVWDQASGSYKAWTSIIPPNLESPIIASGQGFFIHTNEENTDPILLSVTEDIKVDGQPEFLRESNTENILQIIAENSNRRQDVAYLSLYEGATLGFDSHLDAIKLTGNYVNLSSLSETGDNLAINALPTNEKDYSIPLLVKSTQEGAMSLTFNNVSSFNNKFDLVLFDSYKNIRQAIREGKIYSFTILKDDTATYGKNRFRIEINKATDKILVEGGIHNRYKQPLTQVDVEAINGLKNETSSAISDDKGFFSMKLQALNAHQIRPEKSDIYHRSAVNFADYVTLYWLAKGRNRAVADSEFIAADLDRSGNIDSKDVKALRKIITGYQRNMNQPFNYLFMSDSYRIQRIGSAYSFDAGLSVIPDIKSKNSVNLAGIIPGDVILRSMESNRQDSAHQPLVFILGSPVSKGNNYQIPVYCRNFSNVAGFLLHINDVVESVEGVEKQFNTMTMKTEDGVMIWINDKESGRTLADGSLLFHLMVPNRATSTNIVINNLITSEEHMALNSDMDDLKIIFEDISAIDKKGNAFLGAYPNPFNNNVGFRLKVEKPETAKFYLFGANGTVIHEATVSLNAGLHDLDLKKDLGYNGYIPKGLTIFKIQLSDMIISDKLIRK